MTWIKEGFTAKEFYFVYQSDALLGMFRLMYFDEKYWGARADRFDKAAYVHSLTIKREFVGQGFIKVGEVKMSWAIQNLYEKLL